MGDLPPRRSHLAALAAAWTAFAVYGSLVPLLYRPIALDNAIEQFRALPPLGFGLGTRADVSTNVLLFIPLTFLWMGALTCGRSRVTRFVTAAVLAPVAAVTSVAIEFAQIWFAGRTTSLNDIAAQMVGGVIGIGLWLAVGDATVRWLRDYAGDRKPRSRLSRLLGAYVLVLSLYSVMPLDLTLSITDLYHKYRAGHILLVPFSFPYESVSTMVYQHFADIIEFVPVGIWAAMRRRAGSDRDLATAMLAGMTVVVGIECTQLLVLSRYTDVTDVVMGAIGVSVGAWVVRRYSAGQREAGHARSEHPIRAALPLLISIAGYSAFLAGGFWFPFNVTTDHALVHSRLESFYRVPFTALYQGGELNALKQMLLRLVLYAPLGVLWAFVASRAATKPTRLVIALAGLGYSAAVALCVELVQILMPPKIADSTEVGLSVIGVMIGLVTTMRLLRVRSAR